MSNLNVRMKMSLTIFKIHSMQSTCIKKKNVLCLYFIKVSERSAKKPWVLFRFCVFFVSILEATNLDCSKYGQKVLFGFLMDPNYLCREFSYFCLRI